LNSDRSVLLLTAIRYRMAFFRLFKQGSFG
jgi:hypothetical protein